jgi:phosphopantetheinyl transferase (holo-ACP synthase)
MLPQPGKIHEAQVDEDIEIQSQPSGQPVIQLSGESLRIAAEQGITDWHISISHIETHATASAIGWCSEFRL